MNLKRITNYWRESVSVLFVVFGIFVPILGLFFSVKYVMRLNNEMNEYRKEFITYLETVEDLEGLKMMGLINSLGIREDQYVFMGSVLLTLKKKIKRGEVNQKYFDFYEKCITLRNKGAPLISIAIICFAVAINAIISVFNKV